jgi:hypothetical protein
MKPCKPLQPESKTIFSCSFSSMLILFALWTKASKKKSARTRRKHLNISKFGLIEDGTVKQTCHKVVRLAIVLTTITAWFSISNHCTVGALVAVAKAQSAPRMHCHGSEPSPSKKSSDGEMPCCKVLRATTTNNAKTLQPPNHDFLGFQSWITSDMAFSGEASSYSPIQELDTGPPFATSFAESVLQRSILAHAPPLFLI